MLITNQTATQYQALELLDFAVDYEYRTHGWIKYGKGTGGVDGYGCTMRSVHLH